MNNTDRPAFTPQEGAQTAFLSSNADICVYGGAKGGGKTYGLLLEAARHFCLSGINGFILRRTGEQMSKAGSIWHEALKMYAQMGIKANRSHRWFQFNQNLIKFDACQYDEDALNYQGSQADFVFFDELTQFTEYQFWYISGCMRSTTGQVRPYVRATCNPDRGWVYDLLSWWIDPKTHYPVPERAGKTIYIVRMDERMLRFEEERAADLWIKKNGRGEAMKRSLCFIPATVNDNQILLEDDPDYMATLAQLPANERLNYMYGRWFFDSSGKLFKAAWFKKFLIYPPEMDCVVITCDTASSTKTANDWSVFAVYGKAGNKLYLLKQIRGKFEAVEQLAILISLIETQKADCVSIERASTGFYLIDEVRKRCAVDIKEMTRDRDKYQRAYNVQHLVENGHLHINPKADYYADFIAEVSGFSPENKSRNDIKDDQVDCMLDALYLTFVEKINYSRKGSLRPKYADHKIRSGDGQIK